MSNLYEKLANIKKDIRHQNKDKTSYGFDYISADKIYPIFNQLAEREKVLLIPEGLKNEYGIVPDYYNAKTKDYQKVKIEKKSILHNLQMRFTFVNIENPKEQLVCEWATAGSNNIEMGIGSAQTYGMRRFLLFFFQISDGKDDPDLLHNTRNKNAPTKKDITANKDLLEKIKTLLPSLHNRILPIVEERHYAEFLQGISGQVRNWIKDNTNNVKPYLDIQKVNKLEDCNYMQLVDIVNLIQIDNKGE